MHINQLDYIPVAVSGLEAMIFPAEDCTQAPAVFVVHGRTGNIFKRFPLARRLQQAGINAIVVELRNHGRRFVDQRHFFPPDPLAPLELMGIIIGSVQDLALLSDLLHARYNLNLQRLGAIGISLGAQVVYNLLLRNAMLRCCVCTLGGWNISNEELASLQRQAASDQDSPAGPCPGGIAYLAEKYFLEDNADRLAERPLLYQAGAADEKVPPALLKKNYQRILKHYTEPSRIQYKAYAETGHFFSPQMETDALGWFKKWL